MTMNNISVKNTVNYVFLHLEQLQDYVKLSLSLLSKLQHKDYIYYYKHTILVPKLI